MEWFEKYKEKFLEIWGKINKAQKIIIVSGVVVFFVFLIIFSVLSSKVNYEPLFTELTAKDAAKVKAKLDKMGIEYRLLAGGGTIEVDATKKYAIRLDLAKDEALPTGGSVGFEIFNNTKIGATEFDKKMMFLRAQKGELEKTITTLEQIKRAAVNITPANDSVFAEEKTEAKASILIQLQPFEMLNEENIKSIIALAASAVENLSPENIEVIDTNGNILSDRVNITEGEGKSTNEKLELQNKIEKDLEKKARGVLSVLGNGNYKVKISVYLDFDKEDSIMEMYTTPTVSGEQLREGLIRSSQIQKEIYSGDTGEKSGGVAGTASNIPGYVSSDSENSGRNYKKENNIINYEMNKTNSTYEKALGKIKKMSVSVSLNKKATYFSEADFTEKERIKFEGMVKNAINFDKERGDSIYITALPFDTQTIDKFQKTIENQKRNEKNIILGILSIILLLILIVTVMLIKRKIENKKLKEKERREVEEMIPEFDEVSLGEQLSVEEQEEQAREEGIKGLAKKQPENVASLIRTWLMED